MQPSRDVSRLIEIMAALRAPKTGCAWDLQQTHESLAPYALEEAYEVVDAIERGDMDDLRDELGDLLLQVVFHARLAEEAGLFAFGDVVEEVSAKMVRRHPHVFCDEVGRKPAPKSGVDKIWEAMKARRSAREGNGAEPASREHGLLAAMAAAEDKVAFSNATWEQIKAEERRAKGVDANRGALSGIAAALPGLIRAVKLQKKASAVGFDWHDTRLVLAKVREELDELQEEVDRAADGAASKEIEGEIGDLLFAIANLSRHVGVDPEAAVRATNAKFERRFAFIEKELSAKGSSPAASDLAEMDGLWDAAKAAGL